MTTTTSTTTQITTSTKHGSVDASLRPPGKQPEQRGMTRQPRKLWRLTFTLSLPSYARSKSSCSSPATLTTTSLQTKSCANPARPRMPKGLKTTSSNSASKNCSLVAKSRREPPAQRTWCASGPGPKCRAQSLHNSSARSRRLPAKRSGLGPSSSTETPLCKDLCREVLQRWPARTAETTRQIWPTHTCSLAWTQA